MYRRLALLLALLTLAGCGGSGIPCHIERDHEGCHYAK
jgi:hypothetical protein